MQCCSRSRRGYNGKNENEQGNALESHPFSLGMLFREKKHIIILVSTAALTALHTGRWIGGEHVSKTEATQGTPKEKKIQQTNGSKY